MSATLEELQDPEVNKAKNIDALGKEWRIHPARGTSLYYVRPEPDREDAVIPPIISGRWTNPTLLQAKIDEYLVKSWNHAAAVDLKLERKREVSLEQIREKRKANDAGKST